jgi:membrane peptidoglycan carboxypeptidase
VDETFSARPAGASDSAFTPDNAFASDNTLTPDNAFASDDALPAGPEPRSHRRAPRWRRVLTRALIVAFFWTGAMAGAAEAYVETVPVPDIPPQPEASVLYYADGHTILARVGVTDHSDVPIAQVPIAVREAVLAAEDRDFYNHPGVSLRGVLRAAVADAHGAREGASTITQQYARNAFLTQDVTVERKAREFALAVNLERQFTKNQILERYLNTIYFGRNAYGIAAAAHAYFGITPDRLTFAQGAALAAVIKDPYRYDPANDATSARLRWDWIVASARTLGWAPAGPIAYPKTQPSRSAVAGPNGLIVDQVEQELAGHGITSQQLHTRGLAVVTTIDPAAQRSALDTIATQLHKEPAGVQAALVAVDPATGGVRAYYGSDKGSGYFDYAAALHPAASTFKPIVLAGALTRGIGYQSRWDGSSPRLFPDRNGVPLRNNNNLQCPNCTLEAAMVSSLNTPYYAVAERIGADQVRSMAVRLGIPDQYDGHKSMVDVKGDPDPGKTRADIAIGRYPVTPADLATVYATFAAGGVRQQRHFVQSVTGDTAWKAQRAPGRQVLDPRIADDVSTVLQAVVRGDHVQPGRPAAGKTGTQQYRNTADNQDAWMAGYTPELATALWLGKAVPGPLRDKKGRPIDGDTVPAKMWSDFTREALTGVPPVPLPPAAHVGRADVGDAGHTHDGSAAAADGKNPDEVADLHGADSGYEPVVHTEHTGKRLALTFDDGPSEYTPQVLDLLDKYHIKATFCMVGENVSWYPDTVKRIVADGHRLCNHSMHHDDLGVLPAAAGKADIQNDDAQIEEAVPGAVVTYYRAPYGDFGPTAKVASQLGHTPLGWLVDPDDWTLPGASVIATRIEQQLTPRAVVLVHDGGGNRQETIDALKVLIPKLLHEGWTFDFPQTTVATHRPTPPSAPSSSGTPSAPASQPTSGISVSPSDPSSGKPTLPAETGAPSSPTPAG